MLQSNAKSRNAPANQFAKNQKLPNLPTILEAFWPLDTPNKTKVFLNYLVKCPYTKFV